MEHQSQTQQLAWQQPCLTLSRRKLASYSSPSSSMPVMVRLNHRIQSRLKKLWKVDTVWPLILFFMAPLMLTRPHFAHTHPLLQRYCEQETSPDGELKSQAKILEFSIWLVDEAVQQNGARYSFSSVG